jgi:hypothetical protein
VTKDTGARSVAGVSDAVPGRIIRARRDAGRAATCSVAATSAKRLPRGRLAKRARRGASALRARTAQRVPRFVRSVVPMLVPRLRRRLRAKSVPAAPEQTRAVAVVADAAAAVAGVRVKVPGPTPGCRRWDRWASPTR